MLYWKVISDENKDRRQIIMSKVPEDIVLTASVQIPSIEFRVVDTIFERSAENQEKKNPCWNTIP